MSGSGGGTSYQQVDDYVSRAHGLVLAGFQGPNPTKGWDDATSYNTGGDYWDQPSVLRYLKDRGITDEGGNPYEGVSSYDPEVELDEIQESLDTFVEEIGDLNPQTDIEGFYTAAETIISTNGNLDPLDISTIIDGIIAVAKRGSYGAIAQALDSASLAARTDIVAQALSAFRSRARLEHFDAVSRFAGPMAELGAVNSLAYVMGMARLESDYENRMNQYDAEYTLPLSREAFGQFMSSFSQVIQSYLNAVIGARSVDLRDRTTGLTDAVRVMLEAQQTRLEAYRQAAIMQGDVSKTKLVAIGEQYDKDLEYDVKGLHWDMELFQMAGNIMSAVTGSVVPNAGKPSRLQSGIAGMMTGAGGGALLGAKMGATLGPHGAAIGAAAGGALGLVGGLFG